MRRRARLDMLLAIGLLLLLVGSSADAVHPDSVGVWLFDEGQGNAVVDLSGHGHNGVAVGGDLEWDAGKVGTAARFKPGVHVEVPHTNTLNLEQFTVEAWVNFIADTGGGEQNIAYKQVGDDRLTRNYTLKMWNGNIYGIFASGGNTDAVELVSVTAVTDAQWHHVAVTYDLKTARLYIDGQLEVEGDLTDKPETNDAPIRIGAGIDGLIDELQILGVALTADEIAADMSGGIQLAVHPAGKVTTTWGRMKATR